MPKGPGSRKNGSWSYHQRLGETFVLYYNLRPNYTTHYRDWCCTIQSLLSASRESFDPRQKHQFQRGFVHTFLTYFYLWRMILIKIKFSIHIWTSIAIMSELSSYIFLFFNQYFWSLHVWDVNWYAYFYLFFFDKKCNLNMYET